MARRTQLFARQLARGAAAFLGLVLVAAPVGAALLPATGEYRLHVGSAPPVVLTGSGSAASNGGPGSSHTLPAGFFDLTAPATVAFSPTLFGWEALTIPSGLQNVAGSFAPGGTMPLIGTGHILGPFGSVAGFVPLTPIGGTGSAGVFGAPFAGTLLGAPWQGAGGPARS